MTLIKLPEWVASQRKSGYFLLTKEKPLFSSLLRISFRVGTSRGLLCLYYALHGVDENSWEASRMQYGFAFLKGEKK